ncbi:hypothetical protein A9308_07995 [Moraxella atlantae]|uniref:Uncharacterized protein n=1 Tax=Faucicola atlantae TaxID=34059 RepID=A0A1B8QB40_9GAMM|nr:hypothetical protein A9308_07995 [Moraxella atlantae]
MAFLSRHPSVLQTRAAMRCDNNLPLNEPDLCLPSFLLLILPHAYPMYAAVLVAFGAPNLAWR